MYNQFKKKLLGCMYLLEEKKEICDTTCEATVCTKKKTDYNEIPILSSKKQTEESDNYLNCKTICFKGHCPRICLPSELSDKIKKIGKIGKKVYTNVGKDKIINFAKDYIQKKYG
jgi:hypothetical protein